MDRAGFGLNSPGNLVATIGDRKAFVPDPLPPAIDLSLLAGPIAQAAASIGELNGIGRTLQNPYLLIRPLQYREAVSSSAMEGTYTTLPELFLLESGADVKARSEDTREVWNYTKAMSHALDSLETVPISERLMRECHELLLGGVRRDRGALVRPGEFKRDQNWIGGGSDIAKARFIPPPRDAAIDGLYHLMQYLHREDREATPAVIDAALLHYQFEALHPFDDGNGRIGRMLVPLMLIERGAMGQPLLYISPALERRRDEYIDIMFRVSQRGEWFEWLAFFLDIIVEASASTIAVTDRLLQLQRDYRQTFQQARSSALLLRIIDLAFERAAWRVSTLADALGVTYAGAAHNVRQLVDAGVAHEVQGMYPKTIIFPEIVEAINLEV
jgi:Fic family protein